MAGPPSGAEGRDALAWMMEGAGVYLNSGAHKTHKDTPMILQRAFMIFPEYCEITHLLYYLTMQTMT